MKEQKSMMSEAENEAYRSLANAIIMQAVKDYRKALKYDHCGIKRECCRFYRSEWFKTLTSIDGEHLISELKSEVQ